MDAGNFQGPSAPPSGLYRVFPTLILGIIPIQIEKPSAMMVFFWLYLEIFSYSSGVLYLRDVCGRTVLKKTMYSSIAFSNSSKLL